MTLEFKILKDSLKKKYLEMMWHKSFLAIVTVHRCVLGCTAGSLLDLADGFRIFCEFDGLFC